MSLLKKYLSERAKTQPQEDKLTEAGTEERGVKQEKQVNDKAIQNEEPESISASINFSEQFKMFDLNDEKLYVNINQISYVPNALPERCGKAIIECVENEAHEWTYLKTRRLKYFGGLPETSRAREVLPPWLRSISNVLVERKIFPVHLAPNHVLINQYQPGEGIMHHTDGPLYHDCVVILTFGFPAVMSFRPRLTAEQIGSAPSPDASSNENSSKNVDETTINTPCNILLEPNSLLYFSNEAYSSYLHGIDTWDHVLQESHDDLNCHDSFVKHVSSLQNVIDKGDTKSLTQVKSTDGLCHNLNGQSNNCIRTSLTIRHMF